MAVNDPSTNEVVEGQESPATDESNTTETKREFTPEEQAAEIERLRAESERHRKKAAEYRAQLEDGTKSKESELEALQARLAEIEKERFEARVDALKAQYNLTDEDVELFTDDLEYNTRLAVRLSGVKATNTNVGTVVPGEGNAVTPPVDEVSSFSRQLFSKN